MLIVPAHVPAADVAEAHPGAAGADMALQQGESSRGWLVQEGGIGPKGNLPADAEPRGAASPPKPGVATFPGRTPFGSGDLPARFGAA